ncbi:MAG: histidine phosphatase family protein [Gammaproteobacteria bacterium]|nr:histidine phosphatase family protein [Sideroxydans sp.]MBU3904153.1 histidine phosphatase family protein [Gammaproteobacteria bacterium]MBU4046314.1 histidine phosphatase family protein [Gammaproteobacteria bacterium]MBU4150050.1 histidine phosphatase family protein [Gammaproteobacteria bacterium]
MKVVLVRHGESEGNVIHEINDDPKRVVNLTARGRQQAEAAAERLCRVPFTHAYVSEFPRAQQTMDILLRHHALHPEVDARLNERISGMDGQHVDRFNDLVRPDYLHIKPPKGESFIEQMERLRSFLDEAAARHPQAMVLVVSHENPIIAVLTLLSATPEMACLQKLDNCGSVEIEWG